MVNNQTALCMTDAKRKFVGIWSVTNTKTQFKSHVDGIWLGSEYLANESTKYDDLL